MSSTKKTSKYKENKQSNVKESNTLDNKHRIMVKYFSQMRNDKDDISQQIININQEINSMDERRDSFTLEDIKHRAHLLDKKDSLELQIKSISNNYDEMDYYDNAGDLISDYYEMRDTKEVQVKESRNILEFLFTKKEKTIINPDENKPVNRANLFEKYCQRVDGIRINHDDGSNRIKYCTECKIEKILDMTESAYICPCCGDSEMIILDEDRQIKDYSPYRKVNHFREWLNQFQAKQSPDIPENVFIDIVKELNKRRIITRDMEKLFISMFFKIQDPWEMYKHPDRKNFLSYSYVLHKFCELLELDHLLDCFPLHKDSDKIMENDQLWEKICKHLKWEYISSFK